MKGLLLKDIINLKQQAKIYLFIIAIWMALGFSNKDSAFFSGVIMMFTVLVPISAIAYDEKAKWDRYALTMPVSKTDLVLSKYLLASFCAFIGGLLSVVVSIIITKDIANSLISSMAFISIGMIAVSVILPIIFKFGVEKGRMLMMAVIFFPIILAFLLKQMNLPMPSEKTIEILVYFSPAVAILMNLISVSISKTIYQKKEF